MGFVRIENYDGNRGYIGRTKLDSLESEGIIYLFDIPFNILKNPDSMLKLKEVEVYRVV